MVPNLILSPIAGAYVDRWDQKQVLVVSDILRAAARAADPGRDPVSTSGSPTRSSSSSPPISIFFRPARQADPAADRAGGRDLLSANSAMWVGETLADVINYPIAGLFVVFLAVVAGARVLVRRRDLPRLGGAARDDRGAAAGPEAPAWPAPGRGRGAAADGAGRRRGGTRPPGRRPIGTRSGRRATDDETAADAPRSIVADLKAGWAFLRHETVLLANTLQGTAGQFSLGVLTVASLILAKEITPSARTTRTAAPTRSWRRRSAWAAWSAGSSLGRSRSRVRKGG